MSGTGADMSRFSAAQRKIAEMAAASSHIRQGFPVEGALRRAMLMATAAPT